MDGNFRKRTELCGTVVYSDRNIVYPRLVVRGASGGNSASMYYLEDRLDPAL